MHGAFHGRYDRQRDAPGYGRMGRFCVVDTIADNHSHLRLYRDLCQQLPQYTGLNHILVRHQHGAHLSHHGIHAQVHFAPAAALDANVLAYFALAVAKQLQLCVSHRGWADACLFAYPGQRQVAY